MNIFAKVATIAVLATTLMAAQCSQSDIDKQVAAVQVLTQQACQFLPTASSVAAILTAQVPAGQPLVTGVQAVATAICNAVNSTTKSAPQDCPFGKVNGVCVDGKKVS
jgi:hypothetical protein